MSKPIMLTSAGAIVSIALGASYALAATTYYTPATTTYYAPAATYVPAASAVVTTAPTVYTTPAAGDISATIPAGATVVVPAQTGAPRPAEVVNAPGAQLTPGAQGLARADIRSDDGDMSYMSSPTVEQGNNGVTFVSGGVGMQGKSQMEAIQRNYKLKLGFATNTGHYLSNVDVRITDRAGNTVLQTVTKGPFLLANLPAGTYNVTSSYEGAVESRKVTVGSSGLRSYDVRYNQPVI